MFEAQHVADLVAHEGVIARHHGKDRDPQSFDAGFAAVEADRDRGRLPGCLRVRHDAVSGMRENDDPSSPASGSGSGNLARSAATAVAACVARLVSAPIVMSTHGNIGESMKSRWPRVVLIQ